MPTPADLFGALGAIPALPGAACKGDHRLFDSADPIDIEEAVTICATACRALPQCEAWLRTQPDNAVCGVVAGRYQQWVSHPSLRRVQKGT